MTPKLSPRLAAEFAGTYAFVFVGAGAICADAYTGGSAGLIGIALAHGLALTALVVALAPVSGGHVNPAVTLGMVLARRLEPGAGVAYGAAQLAGAAAAGWTLAATFGADVWEPVALGTPLPGPGVAAGTAIFLEAVLTFVLVVAYLQTAGSRFERSPLRAGVAAGAAYAAGQLVASPLTGAALNPARAFGPALGSASWSVHHVYWLGPLLGGALAAVAHTFLTTSTPSVGAEQRPRDGAEDS